MRSKLKYEEKNNVVGKGEVLIIFVQNTKQGMQIPNDDLLAQNTNDYPSNTENGLPVVTKRTHEFLEGGVVLLLICPGWVMLSLLLLVVLPVLLLVLLSAVVLALRPASAGGHLP